jgi:hypothetical protein
MISERSCKYLRTFLAFFVLSVALIAKVPNSHCHCHEPQKAKQTQECPFGKLRYIAATLIFADYLSLPLGILAEYKEDTPEYHFVQERNTYGISNARAPPGLNPAAAV